MPLHNYLFLFVQTISQLLFELAEKKVKNVKASADPKMKVKLCKRTSIQKSLNAQIVFLQEVTVCF